MTNCGKGGYKCKNNIRKEYKAIYDKNRKDKIVEINRELSKPPFLCNKYKTKREVELAVDLINNNPFGDYIVKTPETTKLVGRRKSKITMSEEYVSKVEIETKEGLKDVADFGLSVYPPTAPYYNAAKFIDGGIKDYENGNLDNTIDNSIKFVVPKIITKTGVPKNISERSSAVIFLGKDLSEE